jgi:WD40 repeat protein
MSLLFLFCLLHPILDPCSSCFSNISSPPSLSPHLIPSLYLPPHIIVSQRHLSAHSGLVSSALFIDDGSKLVTAGQADGTIILWKVRHTHKLFLHTCLHIFVQIYLRILSFKYKLRYTRIHEHKEHMHVLTHTHVYISHPHAPTHFFPQHLSQFIFTF